MIKKIFPLVAVDALARVLYWLGIINLSPRMRREEAPKASEKIEVLTLEKPGNPYLTDDWDGRSLWDDILESEKEEEIRNGQIEQDWLDRESCSSR